METRVALVAIIVREDAQVTELNELLHQYGGYIVGRMGVPYRVWHAGQAAGDHRQDGVRSGGGLGPVMAPRNGFGNIRKGWMLS